MMVGVNQLGERLTVNLPLEVSKLVYSRLEGMELFFYEIHGKGATYIV